MEGAIFDCPAAWEPALPSDVQRLKGEKEVSARTWDLLALTPSGVRCLKTEVVRCRILLLPGTCPPELAAAAEAECIVSYGLSPRDSLTLSSLERPVLCVQRSLPRPDGTVVEPQDLPLPPLPEPAEQMLPLLGLKLLHMQLTDSTLLL